MEFYEDFYEEKPEEARKALTKDGVFYFRDTGDPLIDKWESEIAAGLTPDLSEGTAKAPQKAKAAPAVMGDPLDEFEDDYTKPALSKEKYESKFVPMGSEEEKALRETSRQSFRQAFANLNTIKDKVLGAR